MMFNEFANDIKRHPMASLLAVVVTAMGLATTFLILLLYVTDHNTDRFTPDPQQLYRIESQFNLPNGDKVRSAQVPLPLIEALQQHADIDSVGYAYRLSAHLHSQGHVIPKVDVFAVNAAFMSQLRPYREDLPAPGPQDIYITADFNRQYLGLDAPLGKTVNLGDIGQFTIKAIVEPRPDGSLHLPAMIAFAPEQMAGYHDKRLDWYDNHMYAFVRLNAAHPVFDQRLLNQIVADHAPQLPGAPFSPSAFLHFSAKNILEMHYDDRYADEFAITTSKSLLYTLYAAAAFVLLTTVANFFNINGILNASRRRSLRIKRSIGAANTQILAESLAIVIPQFFAIVILTALLLWRLPHLFPDVGELLADQPPARLRAVFFCATLFMGLMVLLSHFLSLYFSAFTHNASQAQNRYDTAGTYGINRFTLACQLLGAGIMVYLWAGVMVQSRYMMDANLGYQIQHRATFILDEENTSLGDVRELQNRLKETLGTSAISLSSWRPFDMSRQILTVQHDRQQVQDQFVTVDALSADKYFADVWGLETLAGQENVVVASQDSQVMHIIITRAFMQAMGLNTYDETLNTAYHIEFEGQQRELRVLRIVENLYLGDRTAKPQPLMIFINDRLEKFATLIYPASLPWGTLTAQLARYGPPGLQLQTAQELHNRHYHSNLLTLKIVRLVALLALVLVLVSTLVMGMAESQRLDKTLSIMEAVGGSVYTSLIFLLHQNVLPMLVSLLMALALGFSLLQHWLQHYDTVAGQAYLFALAALLLLSVGMAAIMVLTVMFSGGRFSLPRARQR